MTKARLIAVAMMVGLMGCGPSAAEIAKTAADEAARDAERKAERDAATAAMREVAREAERVARDEAEVDAIVAQAMNEDRGLYTPERLAARMERDPTFAACVRKREAVSAQCDRLLAAAWINREIFAASDFSCPYRMPSCK